MKKLMSIRDKYGDLIKNQSIFESDLNRIRRKIKSKYGFSNEDEIEERVEKLKKKNRKLEIRKAKLEKMLGGMVDKMEGE